jgi:CBS domain-containing protein
MNVADIMTRNPATIRHDATLALALEIMEEVDCRHLPVLSADSHLVGILSDRDCRLALNAPHILRERWQDEDIIQHTQIAGIMTPAPIVTEADVPACEAARLMLTHHVSALPVMRGETLIGIVTTSDLLAAFMGLVKRLNAYIEKAETPPTP